MDLRAGCGLAATVVALTSCGGSEPGGAEDSARQGKPPRETRLSKAAAQYVERLDAACKESDENSERIRGEIGSLGRRLLPRAEASKQVVLLLDDSYRRSDRITERIRRLEAPPREERFHRRYLEYTDRLDAVNKKNRDTIARGAVDRGEDLSALRRKGRLVTKRRAALVADHGGFRYCG